MTDEDVIREFREKKFREGSVPVGYYAPVKCSYGEWWGIEPVGVKCSHKRHCPSKEHAEKIISLYETPFIERKRIIESKEPHPLKALLSSWHENDTWDYEYREVEFVSDYYEVEYAWHLFKERLPRHIVKILSNLYRSKMKEAIKEGRKSGNRYLQMKIQ